MTQPYRNDQGPSLSANHVGLEELFLYNEAPSDVPGRRTKVEVEVENETNQGQQCDQNYQKEGPRCNIPGGSRLVA